MSYSYWFIQDKDSMNNYLESRGSIGDHGVVFAFASSAFIAFLDQGQIKPPPPLSKRADVPRDVLVTACLRETRPRMKTRVSRRWMSLEQTVSCLQLLGGASKGKERRDTGGIMSLSSLEPFTFPGSSHPIIIPSRSHFRHSHQVAESPALTSTLIKRKLLLVRATSACLQRCLRARTRFWKTKTRALRDQTLLELCFLPCQLSER